MRTWFDLFACQRLSDNRRVGWLNGNGNQIFFTFRAFNIARHPGQRTAGAYPGDKHINLTVGIFPDFRAGGFLMNFRVGRVAELLEQQILCRIAGDDFFGLLNRALHAFRAFREDQIRTQRFQQLTALNTHGFRHSQRQLIAARRRNIGQGDTGIAAGGFNQLNARFQHATLFSIPNHIRTDTAFNAEAWVTRFHLRQNASITDTVQSNQGRMTDSQRVVFINLTHGLSLTV